jgi:hypothetical protein
MSRRPLRDDDVTGVLDDGYPVWVEQLPVLLAAFSELELETAFLVENLKIEKNLHLLL